VWPSTQKRYSEETSDGMKLTRFQTPPDSPEEAPENIRLTIPRGIPITTEIESMNRILRSCQCINIGPSGALVDMGEDKCPDLPEDSKLFVIIQLAGETAKLPGIVRHRHGNRLGIFFPIEGDPNFETERNIFAIILRTLQRGIERRKKR